MPSETYPQEQDFSEPDVPDQGVGDPFADQLPIIERIRRDIINTLNLITTGSGWHQTLDVHSRKQRGEPSPTSSSVLTIVYQGEPERLDVEDMKSTEWTVDFGIKFYIVQSETTTTAIDTAINNARSDIELALCQPATMRRSNLALLTTPAGFISFEDADGEFAGGVVAVTVQFATDFADAFTSHYGVA